MFRTLVIDGIEWKYMVGHTFLVIRREGYSLCTPVTDVRGVTTQREKRHELTGREIADFVRREGLNDRA